MAKTSRTTLARTSRLVAFNAIAPLRPATRRSQAAREPRSPGEFFVRSLFAEQTADVQLSDAGQLKTGVDIVLKVYVEVALVRQHPLSCCLPSCHFDQGSHRAEGIFTHPSTFTLVVRVESALPTGGIHTARVDTWSGIAEEDSGAPLWVSEVRATQPRPLRFLRPLDWLSLYTEAIAARPSGSPGDVWGQLAQFVKSLQVRQWTVC